MRSKLVHRVINMPVIKRYLTGNRFVVRAYFDSLYKTRDPYEVDCADEERRVEMAFDLLGGQKADKALEVGCGEGRYSSNVASVATSVDAFDISKLAIQRAKEGNGENPAISYRTADLLTEDLGVEKYDLIFCYDVLHYFERSQLDTVVEKIVGALAQGGRLLMINIRSAADDTIGIELKDFGAKTIHESVVSTSRVVVEQDLFDSLSRITLFRRV